MLYLKLIRKLFTFFIFPLLLLSGYTTLSYAAKQCEGTQGTGAIDTAPAGCYDYFTFAQIWSPQSPFTSSKSGVQSTDPVVQQQRQVGYKVLSQQYAAQHVTPHGLWPNFLRNKPSYPVDCDTEEVFVFENLTEKLRKELKRLYPQVVYGLARHEWDKHGTCTGWSAEKYFSTIANLNKQLKTPAILIENIGKSVSHHQLLAAYGNNSQHVYFSCDKTGNKQHLSQIFTLWDKTLSPLSLENYQAITPCDEALPIHIRKAGKFITLEELESSIQHTSRPLRVGFDVDDTLLFSSSSFYYAFNNYTKESEELWAYVNNNDDKSLPKSVAYKLIDMHKKRGDSIYIITARFNSEKENLSQVLANTFEFTPAEVIFTNEKDKAPFIKKHTLDMYYGDADSDMSSAYKALVRPIRVQRSGSSNNSGSAYNPGSLGEEVLFNSAD